MTIDEEAKRMEDMRSKGGGRLMHCTVDGDVPLCLRRNLRDSKEESSSNKKNGNPAAAKVKGMKEKEAEAAIKVK